MSRILQKRRLGSPRLLVHLALFPLVSSGQQGLQRSRPHLIWEQVVKVLLHPDLLAGMLVPHGPPPLDLPGHLFLNRSHVIARPVLLLKGLPGLEHHDALFLGLQVRVPEVLVGPAVDLPGALLHVVGRALLLAAAANLLLLPLLPRLQPVERHGLEPRERNPDLDVLRSLHQPLVQVPGPLPLTLADLEVDVHLPQVLRLVEHLLLHSELEDRPGPLRLPEVPLQVSELAPSVAARGHDLEIFLVQRPTPVHVAQLHLHLDVRIKDLLLGRHPYRPAIGLPRPAQVPLPHLELRSQDPHLGEGEGPVRDELEALLVDLPGPASVLRLQLLVKRVVDPQVDVPPPEPLLLRRGHIRDRPLVELPHLVVRPAPLLQSQVVKPSVVGRGVGFQVLLILEPLLSRDHILDLVPVPMLLLKPDVVRVELLGLLPGDIVQRVLVDCPGAVELLAKLLKLGKLLEKVNGVGVEPELPDRGLVHLPCPLPLPELALELGIIHPSLHRRVAPNVSLVNPPGPVDLVIPQLHFDVGSPPLVVGLPLHPPLEDLASPRDVAQHLLHVDVLVPQLIYPREERARPVPHVPCVVHILVPHFHLGVLEPKRDVPVRHLERPLVHGPRPRQVVLRVLPFRVLAPRADVPSHLPH
mmetsp:Transcript_3550/g.12885  ORF Transcript_3550/g.12885 Transcript_3550/m.12885 type:complete len:640 (+) Transcript_3550:27-1946(+)